MCQTRSDLSELLRKLSIASQGIMKLSLLYCVLEQESDAFWDGMQLISAEGKSLPNDLPFHLIQEFEDLDWRGHVEILLKFLKSMNTQLVRSVLETFYVETRESLCLDLSQIEWWLEWMRVESASQEGMWFVDRFATFIGRHADKLTHEAIIKSFNETSNFRVLLANYVLPKIPSLTIDKLSEGGIAFLISDLSSKTPGMTNSDLIGQIATESFVNKYLLPLLDVNQEPLKTNLRAVLKTAGTRHKKRYFSEQET
jgi:hypothetical protein